MTDAIKSDYEFLFTTSNRDYSCELKLKINNFWLAIIIIIM